jgi:tRNA G18 (ribose-2'-O)-methylase SpoU
MIRRLPIEHIDDPRLAPYRNMRAQTGHLGDGVFVTEGPKVVERLMDSEIEIQSILMPPEWLPDFQARLDAYPRDLDLFVAPLSTLEQLTGYNLYQGVLALGRVPPPTPLQAFGTIPGPRLLVALDGVGNSENTGTIIRTATAMGVQGLITGETASHPYMRRSVRSSMGAVFRMPYHCAFSLRDTLLELRGMGVHCVAAHPHVDGRTLWQAEFTGDTCLVLGAEGNGIRPEVLSACADAVALPMLAGVDSLNVASAAAVFLAEVRRQRRGR